MRDAWRDSARIPPNMNKPSDIVLSDPPLLNREILSAYDAQLRRAGVPVEAWARPGLSEKEIVDAVSPLGLSLPYEARVWWSWRNGEEPAAERHLWRPGRSRGLALDEAVARYRQSRKVAERGAEGWPGKTQDDLWRRAWFPLVVDDGAPVTVIDCSVGEGAPTPITFVDWEELHTPTLPSARSLGEMISWWTDALMCGAWTFDPSTGTWAEHLERIDESHRFNALM